MVSTNSCDVIEIVPPGIPEVAHQTQPFYFTSVKETLIEIGCVVTSLVVGCHARALWPNGAS